MQKQLSINCEGMVWQSKLVIKLRAMNVTNYAKDGEF